MSAVPTARSSRGWWLALAAALAFLAASRALQWRTFNRHIAFADTTRQLPLRDARSPTGYAGGVRDQLLQPGDSYHWLMQTQQMVAQDTTRVRWVDYDNAPTGRETHWSGSMRWWLVVVAWVESEFTGAPLPIATAHAAVYANALLLPLFLLGLTPLVAARFGAWPAGLFAIGATTLGAFRAEFGIAVLDHHGVVGTCALLMVIFIAAGGVGWIRGPKRDAPFTAWLPDIRSARRWWIASSLAGAVGLWISASTVIPVFAGIGLGAAIGMWLVRSDDPSGPSAHFHPELWREWGCVGGVASLAFYALEYFPAHVGWRLEVNHPLYALAWAAAGDLLCRISQASQVAKTERPSPGWSFIALDLLAIAAVPLAVILLRDRVFAVSDPVLWLHREFIAEFYSSLVALQNASAHAGTTFLLRDFTLLPLLIIPAIIWLRKRLPPAARSLLLLALCPAIVGTLLGLHQIKWLSLTNALWLAAVVILTHLRLRPLSQYPWRPFELPALAVFFALVFLPLPVATFTGLKSDASTPPPRDILCTLVERDFAHWLRRQVGADRQVVVASAASPATDLIYFGGFKALGTFYWENRPGLHVALDLHTAKTASEAYAILQRHGVTHWVIFSWDDFPVLSRGFSNPSSPDKPSSFLLDLLGSKQPLPPWARRLPYEMPFRSQLPQDWILALEILPPSAISGPDQPRVP